MSARHHAAVGALMLATSAGMLSPFVNYSQFASALHSGDGRVQAWVLAWVGHALGAGRPLFDANMFYPTRNALAHTDHMVALGVLGAPIWWATKNAIVEFNLLQVIGPALSAYAMFVLAHAWTRDSAASIVAGLAYGFSTFTLLHNAHLNLTWSFGLPLAVLGLDRWWSEPTWPRLARWWIPALFTVLVSWYLAFLLAILLFICAIWLLLTRERTNMATRVIQVAASGVLALAIVLPILAPYLGRVSEAGEAAALSADVRSYLVPSEHTVVGRWLVGRSLAAPQSFWGERTLFLGWTTVTLSVIGCLTTPFAQRRRVLLLLLIAAAAVSLSFGPSPGGYAPFDLLAQLPGVSGFRAAARFALLVTFAVALLAGLGIAWLGRQHRYLAAVVPAVCAVLVLGEVFVVDFPAGKPVAEATPEVYRLAARDNARAAVALPMYAGQTIWFLEGDYLLYSTTGDFVPLGNGIGRWVPDEYFALAEAARTFPSPETAAALRVYGITHVLFHGQRFGADAPGLLDRVRQGEDFSIVATRGSDTLLRLKSSPGVRRMTIRRIALGLGLYIGLSLAAQAQAPVAEQYFPPAGQWARKAPAEVGMDAARLEAAIAFAQARETSMPRDFSTQEKIFGTLLGPIPKSRAATNGLVIRKGYVVAEFGETNSADPTYSVAKSMLATVAGIAVREGLIKDINATVGSQIKDGGYDSPQNAKVTWRHHLQQESEWEGEMWGKKHDFVGTVAFGDGERKPRDLQAPGTFYEYNDVRINRFALSLLRLFKKPVPDVFRDEVMNVIGASNTWRWIPYNNSSADVEGKKLASVSGGTRWGGGVWINSWDMARFGYLWLRNGRWGTREIIPPAYVRAALTPSAHGPDYGYLWWLNTKAGQKPLPTNSFEARGAGSNTIFVSPDHDLVIVWRWHGGGKTDFFRQVIAAIQAPTSTP